MLTMAEEVISCTPTSLCRIIKMPFVLMKAGGMWLLLAKLRYTALNDGSMRWLCSTWLKKRIEVGSGEHMRARLSIASRCLPSVQARGGRGLSPSCEPKFDFIFLRAKGGRLATFRAWAGWTGRDVRGYPDDDSQADRRPTGSIDDRGCSSRYPNGMAAARPTGRTGPSRRWPSARSGLRTPEGTHRLPLARTAA